MAKFNYFRILTLLILFFITKDSHLAFASDNKGEEIYFENIEKKASLSEEKNVFLISLEDNYKDIAPQELKSVFKKSSDVQKWLEETFEAEVDHFRHHPKVYLITAKTKKQDRVVGIAIFELLDNANRKIIHVRQMSVLPEYQRRGIGTKLLFSIKSVIPNIDEMIIDTRKINIKAYKFYNKHGFSLTNTPNDSNLDPNKYCGFSLKLSQ